MSVLVGLGCDEAAARELVTDVRRGAVAELEERCYTLEGKIAAHYQGAVRIPRVGHPMFDAWRELVEACGRGVSNFTVDGRRLFAAHGSDGLDTFLERYDPGSVNYNAAVLVFTRDMSAVLELRRQRGAIMRDGLRDPSCLAADELELVALTGLFDDAVRGVLEVEEERILAAHYAELDELAGVMATVTDTFDGDTVKVMPEPVGIKEIGERLGVQRATVDQWIQRGLLPASRWIVGGRPCWDWDDIELWAVETGRLEVLP